MAESAGSEQVLAGRAIVAEPMKEGRLACDARLRPATREEP